MQNKIEVKVRKANASSCVNASISAFADSRYALSVEACGIGNTPGGQTRQ